MIIIALDFGTKNIGVAVGQNYTNTARSLPSIKVKNKKLNIEKLNKLIDEWKPNAIVVGHPLNIDGTKQKITQCSENFSKKLKNIFKIPILLHDERLSTVEAKAILFEKYGYKSLKKERIDSMSAVIILESWFLYSKN
ncbi:hypothetical 16.0 kDa protein [Buchnera aphidicola str. Bp (Baizongia pistaciae)]|uniref:Putative pre-16S rRNA nuclease n=1 Tax=Buchnera aphidicola subsp. Baizongia pistaciae (strain Bp) TaxID=224915 RepID=YQGF_BUCBP|nr:Holliday junction resolvase RuvX [Buchnera aphidicola]Q89A50.1 RecName: Full=Putative pre-16S rRNA nuclease [Buchnera aphidicola str. Bp (Baizongia pistaciae)]AAO27197.1 hypothetical 16.0 kDa protein [Buchnera aphidicola str. Bp (Baizongia pistaciae)]